VIRTRAVRRWTQYLDFAWRAEQKRPPAAFKARAGYGCRERRDRFGGGHAPAAVVSLGKRERVGAKRPPVPALSRERLAVVSACSFGSASGFWQAKVQATAGVSGLSAVLSESRLCHRCGRTARVAGVSEHIDNPLEPVTKMPEPDQTPSCSIGCSSPYDPAFNAFSNPARARQRGLRKRGIYGGTIKLRSETSTILMRNRYCTRTGPVEDEAA